MLLLVMNLNPNASNGAQILKTLGFSRMWMWQLQEGEWWGLNRLPYADLMGSQPEVTARRDLLEVAARSSAVNFWLTLVSRPILLF